MAVKRGLLSREFIKNWSAKNDFAPVFTKKAAESRICAKKEIHSGLPVYLCGTDFRGLMGCYKCFTTGILRLFFLFDQYPQCGGTDKVENSQSNKERTEADDADESTDK